MKIFKTIEPISGVFSSSGRLLKKFGIEVESLSKSLHPQEDYAALSKKYPIFAVADGVTLELEKNRDYPKKSGSGEVAKIFCQAVIKEAEKEYKRPDMKKIFSRANAAVAKYNRSRGRFGAKLNYWDFDLFSATGVFAVVKDSRVFWASICDSAVVHLKKSGGFAFKSPDGWRHVKKNLPPDWLKNSEKERKKFLRKDYRNALGPGGKPIGYGVINGEISAEEYLDSGVFLVSAGDVIMLITDGFENYLKLDAFRDLFFKWPRDLKSKLKKITRQKSIDDPMGFGLERAVIAVKF